MFAPARLDLSATPGWAAAGAAVLVATAMLSLPAGWLETAGVQPPGASPTGPSFRFGVALAAGLVAAIVTWAVLLRSRRDRALLAGEEGAPVLRRADAHPDAPPRRPLSAAELAVPPDPSSRDLPTDLDTPLAAFDPDAVPARPLAPVAAVAALAPGERIETFRLAPPPTRQPVAPEQPGIDALLRRLEDHAGRRRPA